MKRKKIVKLLRAGILRLWSTIKMPEMQFLPGQLAFFFVLSVIPIIALLGYVGIYFSLSVNQIEDLVRSSFPESVVKLLLPVLGGKTLNTNMFIFLISSFILASNGAYSIIIISNNLYKIKPANVIKRRIKSITITFIIVSLVIFMLIVPTLGSIILNGLANIEPFEMAINEFKNIFNLIKWPLSLIFIYFNIKLIYTIAPDMHLKSREVTRGAIFTTIFWIMAANIYSIYLATFTRYDILYGSISNIIVLLLWVYILSYIFVMGLALNATYKKENDEVA